MLNVENLSICFKNERGEPFFAVKNSSFSIQKGKITAIVGESGSGKSLTALSLLKLLPKDAILSGRIEFNTDNQQIELFELGDKALQKLRGNKISMIFQEPMTSLNPSYTCGNQVMEAVLLHKKLPFKDAKACVLELFRQVKLPSPEQIFNRYPHQISGGQKQRVMIAMAISCNPELLIADEPTTALDVRVQKSIMQLIKDIQQAHGISVLLITHDLALVAEYADEIIVMYKGEIVEQGNTNDILKNPQHNYTKALLECRPKANSKGKRLRVLNDFLGKGISQPTVVSNNNCEPVSEPETVLSVQDISVCFPSEKNIFGKPTQFFTAVDHVSFDVLKNQTIGLVGESGCGKTTLGRTILQLIKPSSGNIFLNEQNIANASKEALKILRKDLQIVFQDPYGSLNPRITIGNAIEEPLAVHGVHNTKSRRKEAVADILEKVGLYADDSNRYPHQFSGGQRQRICIARALALNPSFLVFDESVSALDVSVQAQVLNLINDLKNQYKFTSIFISHDLSVVHYISDKIMVMHQGRIVEQGTANDIFFNPNNAYTQSLIEAIPGKKLNI